MTGVYKLLVGDGHLFFREREGAPEALLSGSRNASLYGDIPISEADYLAGGFTCDNTGEIDNPPPPPTVNPIQELEYVWNNLSSSYAFTGYARVSDNSQVQGYVQAEAGQSMPTPHYLEMEAGSFTVNGKAMNRRFFHGPRPTFHGVLPGEHTFIVRQTFAPSVLLERAIALVAAAGGGGQTTINAVYITKVDGVGWVGLANVNGVVEVIRTGQLADGSQYSPATWTLIDQDDIIGGSFASGGATVQVVWGNLAPGTYTDTWRKLGETNPDNYVRKSYSEGETEATITGPATLAFGASGQFALVGATGTRVWSINTGFTGAIMDSATGVLTNNSNVNATVTIFCNVSGRVYEKQCALQASIQDALTALTPYESAPNN